MSNSTSEREQRPLSLAEIRDTLTAFKPETLGAALMHGYAVHLLSLIDSEAANEPDNQQPVKEESCCISALLHSREEAERERKLKQERK